MKQRIRLLSLTVGATVFLLTIAGMLIVVGIFNESLNWDIFGPRIEAVLYGVFGSSIALACVGVAMTLVLGTQEIVKAFRSIQQHQSEGGGAVLKEAPKGAYVTCLLYISLFLGVIIACLTLVNHGVQKHRSQVFKKMVNEQMEHFQPKLSGMITPLPAPPRDHVSHDLYDLMRTLDNLSFVNRATLYLPDPKDASAMWGYTAWGKYKVEDGFAKFFVAKEFEKAMAAGLAGDEAGLTGLNEKTGFTRYHLITGDEGRSLGVLRIDGNSRENFREYMLGS